MFKFNTFTKSIYFVLSVAFLVWTIYYTFWLQQFGISWRDLPFQIMNAIRPETMPISFLTNYLGNQWGNAFGFGFLSMRYFMIILTVLTAFCSGAYYIYRTRKIIIGILLTGVMILESRFFEGPFGWDVFTFLFTTITLILTLETKEHKDRLCYYIGLGIVSAISVSCRLPNGITIPVLVFAIWLINRKSPRQWILKCILVYLLSFAIALIALIIIATGSISNYISSWSTYGLMKEHGLGLLIPYYLVSFNEIIIHFALFYALLKFIEWTKKVVSEKKPKASNWVYAFFFIFLTAYIIRRMYYDCADSDIPMNYLIVEIFFFIVYCQMKNKWDYWPIACIILLLSLVPPTGSNLGFRKTLAIFALPIALTYVKLTKSQLTILLSVYASIVLFFVPMNRMYIKYDTGYSKCTATTDVPFLKGIYTTPKNAQCIQEVYDASQSLNHEVLVLGDKSLMFDYLTGNRPKYNTMTISRYFWDDVYVDGTINYINENNVKNVLVLKERVYEVMNDRLVKQGFQLTKDNKEYFLFQRTSE